MDALEKCEFGNISSPLLPPPCTHSHFKPLALPRCWILALAVRRVQDGPSSRLAATYRTLGSFEVLARSSGPPPEKERAGGRVVGGGRAEPPPPRPSSPGSAGSFVASRAKFHFLFFFSDVKECGGGDTRPPPSPPPLPLFVRCFTPWLFSISPSAST